MDYFPKMHSLLATPVDKEQMPKYMSNYNSIFCVLIHFSNIYKNILKAQLMENMNKLFLPFIFAYNTHMYVLIRLEEWRKNVNNNYVIGAFLTHIWRAFDCIPHDLTVCLLDLAKICYVTFIHT